MQLKMQLDELAQFTFLQYSQIFANFVMTNMPRIFLLLVVVVVACLATTQPSFGQRKNKKYDTTIRGEVTFEGQRLRSWNGDNLRIKLTEISAKLREYVKLPTLNYPPGHKQWTVKQRREWEDKFAATETGKKVLARNKKMLEEANSFDLKIERDGSFVVYDVPAGEYAIQGRYDRKIGEVNYAYEVFGKLDVDKDVDEIMLDPIRIEITPQYPRGEPAPPFKVTTYNDKADLELKLFEGKLLLINFWSAESPVAAKEQKAVQATLGKDKIPAKEKYSVLSINVDKKRKKALRLLSEKQLLKGSHGFTLGSENPSLFNYGIRGVPSYWLIDSNGKVLINQYEFAKLMRTSESIEAIITERLENNQAPVPAVRPDKQAPVPAVRPVRQKRRN